LLGWLLSCHKGIEVTGVNNTISEAELQQLKSSKQINCVRSNYYNQLFTRYAAGGWTGGDVATSLMLPGGKICWLFGDSFVDTVFADRHRPMDAFIHNSLVVTSPFGFFQTLYNGTTTHPTPYFDTIAPILLWPSCGFVNSAQNKLYVMMVTIQLIPGGGMFGFEAVGNTVGEISLPDMGLQRQFSFKHSTKINWSSASFIEDGFVYLYGAESVTYDKYVHVCRTSSTNPFQTVEYFDGNKWVDDASKTARLLNGVSEQYSFFKHKNKYYLLSQESTFLSADIYIWDAKSPVGPFSNKRKIYHTPEAVGNVITYNATAHPELMVDGMLLVGYCNNSLQGVDIYKNADNYRPYFIWVNNWQ
jgi:hypothetical protein